MTVDGASYNLGVEEFGGDFLERRQESEQAHVNKVRQLLSFIPDVLVSVSVNFARLGFHHGFGLSVTLPLVAGHQRSLDLLYTGRRIDGDAALELGIADRLVAIDEVRTAALDLATDIAGSAPLAVRSIRQTMRGHLADDVRAALARERAEQDRLTQTADWREGVAAMAERRTPSFTGV